MRFLILFLFTALGLAACAPGNNATEDDDGPADGVIETTGTVQYVEVEGGFYGIVAEDGTRYDPSGLPDEFQEDGLRVRFRAEIRENVLTTRMWGQVIRLLEIERE